MLSGGETPRYLVKKGVGCDVNIDTIDKILLIPTMFWKKAPSQYAYSRSYSNTNFILEMWTLLWLHAACTKMFLLLQLKSLIKPLSDISKKLKRKYAKLQFPSDVFKPTSKMSNSLAFWLHI